MFRYSRKGTSFPMKIPFENGEIPCKSGHCEC